MAENKIMTLQKSVELVPPEGCSLALGGLTLYRRPMAFALALLASNAKLGVPKDLTLICFTAGLESDILVGADMVSRVRSCYFGLEAFGLAPYFTTHAAEASIEIIEETEASLAFGLRATLADVGFMPSNAWLGTDLPRLRPDVKTVIDPYSGEELIAFPAIDCDVAVIHALEADPQGNAIIITAEKILPRLEHADIIGSVVNAVVEMPNGAWPTSCHPLYPLDGLATLEYTEKAGTDAYSKLIFDWSRRHGLEP